MKHVVCDQVESHFLARNLNNDTLPKTNSSPLKMMVFQVRNLLAFPGGPPFQVQHLSFRELFRHHLPSWVNGSVDASEPEIRDRFESFPPGVFKDKTRTGR